VQIMNSSRGSDNRAEKEEDDPEVVTSGHDLWFFFFFSSYQMSDSSTRNVCGLLECAHMVPVPYRHRTALQCNTALRCAAWYSW